MLDRLALLSDNLLYFVCDPTYRVIYSNNFFQNTIDITIGSNIFDFIDSEDIDKFNKAINSKSKNFSIKIKVKGHKFELCRFTFDTFLFNHFHFLGVIISDTPHETREANKRMKNIIKSFKHHMNHELLSHQTKVEGGLKLLGMAESELERKEAVLIIENASAALRLAIVSANTKI